MTKIEQARAALGTCEAKCAVLERYSRSRAAVAAAFSVAVDDLVVRAQGRMDRALLRIADGQSPGAAVRDISGPNGAADYVGLVAFAGADAVRTLLASRLEAVVPEGLDAAEFDRLKAEAYAERDRLERLEEELIVAAETAGTPVARRPDCNLAIVLALDDDADDTTTTPQEPDPEVVKEVRAARRARAAERVYAPVPSPYLQKGKA